MTPPKSKLTKELASQWYNENQDNYKQLSRKIESILKEIINEAWIVIHWVYSRTKSLNSFLNKFENKEYYHPSEITDCSGIRIITYVEGDLAKIQKIIKSHFIIDEKNSIDKRSILGTDKVWYQSIHFIAKLTPERLKLPEYQKFSGYSFEIQLRTILQHTWAEIEHDKGYKFSWKLPDHLARRFRILSGVLELADREFDTLAQEIDIYSKEVKDDTEWWKLDDILIDSVSLNSFLNIKFKLLIDKGLPPWFKYSKLEIEILQELENFWIKFIKELDEIIPNDFIDRCLKIKKTSFWTYAWLLRDIMIIENADKYFRYCWENHWAWAKSTDVIKTYIPNIKEILAEFWINEY